MNRAEEFISKKEHELEQLRKDWHPELWALVMEAYAKSQEDATRADAVSIEEAKKMAKDFFYWWYNQDGTNTEQGFEKWFSEVYKPPKAKDNE